MSLGCGCQILHVHARDSAWRVDPTRTLVLRRRYEADLVRRIKVIRRIIKELVLQDDVFGLRSPGPQAPSIFAKSPPRPPKPPPRAWANLPSGEKITAFNRWVRESVRSGILEATRGTSFGRNQAWQDVYLRSAYQKGLASAAQRLGAAGVDVRDTFIDSAFFRPVHADRIGIIFTRSRADLEGITSAMENQLSRALAQGLLENAGVDAVAQMLVDRVDKIGITRARVLARTEIVGANAEGALNTYEEAGLEGVEAQAEFMTTRDNAVCPQCADLEGDVMSIDDARGSIPVHPNCRCTWLPVIDESVLGKVLA